MLHLQEPELRFGIAEVVSHPWFRIGLPQGWDNFNSECMLKQVHFRGVQ